MKTFFSKGIRNVVDPGLILVLVLTLFTAIPLASNPGLPDGTDTILHIYRAAEMGRSWEHGLLFPSWAEGFYLGYGSPLFHFYASLAYYLTSIFQMVIGLSAIDALRWLLLLSLLTCSGGMYLFCKRRSGRLGALIGGLVYVYSPYLMFTEPYARGAFPELLAFAIFPLLLWRLDALRDKPNPFNFLLVILLQAALINAHNLMALTLTAIAFAWVLFETLIQLFNRESSQMNARSGALAALAMIFGILATATFWLPVLLERDSVHLENLLVHNYHGSFLRADTLLSFPFIRDAGALNGLQREPPFLGVAQWTLGSLGAVSALLMYIRGRRTRHPQTFLGSAFFTLLTILLITLMLPTAEGIWSSFRMLQFLQFPWRMMGPVAVCLAVMASMNGLWLHRLALRFRTGAIALFVLLPIVTVVPLLFVPEWHHTTLNTSIGAYHDIEQALRRWGTTTTDEFRPGDVQSMPGPTDRLIADYADGYPVDKLNRSSLPVGAEAELLTNSPQSLTWRVNTPESFIAEIYNFNWLGWRAEVDGYPLEITPSYHGLITVPIPAGEYSLRVYLGSTPARDIATVMSVISIALACLVAILLRRPRRGPRPYWTIAPLRRTDIGAVAFGGAIAVLCVLITYREGVAWLNSPPGEALPAQVQKTFTLDDSLQLLGYNLNGEVFRPGDMLIFSAYWYTLERPTVDFSSFLHLSIEGSLVAQIDKLHAGDRPVGESWGPAGYIIDGYELRIPAHLPAGEYDLIIGLYTCELMPPDDCGSGYRPTVRDENGEVIGDSITLATITIE